MLTLTKTEMWEVPKENVEAVKKAAAEHGAVANPLGADWNEMFHSAPADMRMNPKQSANDGDGQDLQVDHGGWHDGDADGADGRICADQGCRPQHRRPGDLQGGGQDLGEAQRQDGAHDRAHQRRHQEGHVHLARPGRGHRCAGDHHVVAGRQDGRHRAARGSHLFDPAHGRGDARRRRDGRGQDAARACADAGAHARQRSQPARRSPRQSGRRQHHAARDEGHAAAEGFAGRQKQEEAADGHERPKTRRGAKGKAAQDRPGRRSSST